MAQVAKLTATIPVIRASGDDFGAYAVQEALNKQGWAARVQPLREAKKLQVDLKRWGAPQRKPDGAPNFIVFDDVAGAKAIDAAAKAYGTLFAAGKDWLVTTSVAVTELAKDLQPSAIASTTGQYFGEKKAEYDKCIAAGGNALTCGGAGAGLPKWVVPAAIGLGILFVLGQIASVKRAFLGGVR